MSGPTLLPCPFCGAEWPVGLDIAEDEGWFSIECNGCGIEQGMVKASREEAIAAWNSRQPGDALQSGKISLNEARAIRGLQPKADRAVLLPLNLLSCVDVLTAKITGGEMARTGDLIEQAVHGPEDRKVEALRELMRYTRQVLGIQEPEKDTPC